MIEPVLTPDRILDAAEEVFRRYGPSKTTVVDVARSLEVSHGTIYRHFASKTALRDAVAARWLHRVSAPLLAIVQAPDPAPDRLHRWLQQLILIKHQKLLDDPELFATYHALAEESRDVVKTHVQDLISQLAEIIEAGIHQDQFQVKDSDEAARGVFSATVRFHHPAHASEWHDPEIGADFDRVWRLLLAGLKADPIDC